MEKKLTSQNYGFSQMQNIYHTLYLFPVMTAFIFAKKWRVEHF